MQHAPLFIVLLPVSAALLCMLFSRIQKNLGSWIVIGSIAAAFMSAVTVLQQVIADGGKPIHYWMGNWQPPLGIEFVIDPISGVLAVLITFISLLGSLYSLPFVKEEGWLHIGGYYTLYGLMTVGMCGMVITGDVFNLYVFLEVMSLSGYFYVSLPAAVG